MVLSANLGFPRMGLHRELKKALESYWKGQSSGTDLQEVAYNLRKTHWQIQKDAGLDHIPSNDFSLYDHVLDTILMVGAIPERYKDIDQTNILNLYFAMARGSKNVPAMEMTKWFDTNYHYIVPEFTADTQFKTSSTKILSQFNDALALGIKTRPVILGPVSFLLLGKIKGNACALDLLPRLLPVYEEILNDLKTAGAEWVQIDEPCLVLEADQAAQSAYKAAYQSLSNCGLQILLTTYFEGVEQNLNVISTLPIAGLHIDLVRKPTQLDAVCKALLNDKYLSLGVVDGRNIWKNDFAASERIIQRAIALRGTDKLIIAPSCSLLHTPVDLNAEHKLDSEIKNWLAFAVQKCEEVKNLTDAANGNKNAGAFTDNAAALHAYQTSAKVNRKSVKNRASNVTDDMLCRKSVFKQRIAAQQKVLDLPLLPITTIGSYPQTGDVREARAAFKKGTLSEKDYTTFLQQKTVEAMKWQDEIGIDVPVHGEFERNDMVEYFGEQLDGFVFTSNGWVQSYGSRCVKPPIIYGDVQRPQAMTVEWSKFAQDHTDKPVKGMLTGPVTILQWSFVRCDQPRSETCKQIGLAIRDEVADLEKAGIKVIQIDEPALREGLPLRKSDWASYLKWAVDCFRLSASVVKDETQIHTHMCYSEFNDIIESIAALDADVISIETSRSQMELLDAFVNFKYPNDIGPGVYDIHSPRVPNEEEISNLLEKALKVLSPQQLWVNPDCGLKTRGWEETNDALKTMVAATRKLRTKLQAQKVERLSA